MADILLLEPNRLLAQQYKEYLEGRGHKVAWCEDAQSGIIVADNAKPDVVVVELLLSGHSGVEFLYEFRSYAEWQNVPAIVLSSVASSSMDLSAKQLKQLGVVFSLYKPETSLAKMAAAIERSLKLTKKAK